jgi:sterol desaturase/sphingolipid hydroxylase (fatty acid hydroxylase superfamily)
MLRLEMPWTLALLPVGAALWTLGEYVLHRFAMHELKGKGILSREHLEHHVTASWRFDPILLLAWTGVVLVSLVWAAVGWLVAGWMAGACLAGGWIVGYFYYEYQHAQSHLRGPRGRYTRWLRRNHFHHHFGHPMANHGVTTPIWDRVFGTLEAPVVVRVPRRMAPVWMVDGNGDLRSEYADDYMLVGSVNRDDRLAQLDRVRAFASVAPSE